MLNGNESSYMLAFVGAASFSSSPSRRPPCRSGDWARADRTRGTFPDHDGDSRANVGSTFARMVLSSGLKGSVRELTAYQDLFKVTGAVLFVTLLYVEVLTGVPLVRAFLGRLSPRVDRQMALVFLLFNLVTAMLFTLAQPLVCDLLERWMPADAEGYPVEDAVSVRGGARRARDGPRSNREGAAAPRQAPAPARGGHADRSRLVRACRGAARPEALRRGRRPGRAVQHELMNRQLDPGETERLMNLQSRPSLIVYLEDSLRAITAATDAVSAEGRLGSSCRTSSRRSTSCSSR